MRNKITKAAKAPFLSIACISPVVHSCDLAVCKFQPHMIGPEPIYSISGSLGNLHKWRTVWCCHQPAFLPRILYVLCTMLTT